MKTPKYSVFTVFAVLDDFEMHSSPPPRISLASHDQSDAPYAGLPARPPHVAHRLPCRPHCTRSSKHQIISESNFPTEQTSRPEPFQNTNELWDSGSPSRARGSHGNERAPPDSCGRDSGRVRPGRCGRPRFGAVATPQRALEPP